MKATPFPSAAAAEAPDGVGAPAEGGLLDWIRGLVEGVWGRKGQ